MGPPGKRDMTDCHSPATVGESSRRRYEFATSGASLKTTAVRSATNVAPEKTKTRCLRPGFGRSGRAAVPLCPRPEQHAPSESALPGYRDMEDQPSTRRRADGAARQDAGGARRVAVIRTYGRAGLRDCRGSRARA